jgi:AraC-like DNA-binding protein
MCSADFFLQAHTVLASIFALGTLLQQHCIDTQLYLQHDLTVTQLALAIGTNRTYLGQYFSRHDSTYNAYINNLRINHFVSLYREAVATQRSFTVQQLASESGYRSYSTFSLAFKQRMGQSVTAWMRDFL